MEFAFHRLEIPEEVESGLLRSGANGMTVDSEGFFISQPSSVLQICDPAGRTVGSYATRGAETRQPGVRRIRLQTLYVTSGEGYSSLDPEEGTLPWVAVKPPKPRL